MSVLVRSIRGEKIRHKRQGSAAHHAPGHISNGATSAAPQAELGEADVSGPGQKKRITNDAAFYSCQCGYVFEAPVSTSVSCPHCGCAQAW